MPNLTEEYVDQQFNFLVGEHGFEAIQPNHWGAREMNFEYRKGALTWRVSFEPNLPGLIRSSLPMTNLVDKRNLTRREVPKVIYVEGLLRKITGESFKQRYPYHAQLYSAWWPVFLYQQSKYKKELDQEFYQVLSNEAKFIKKHYFDIVEGRIPDITRDLKQIKKELYQAARHSTWTTLLFLLIPLTLYLLLPQTNYWIWSMVVPGLAFWAAVGNWQEVYDFDEETYDGIRYYN